MSDGGGADAEVDAEVDVVVVGLGPGGEKVAAQLAEAGLDVVGIDRHLVGGECRFYGCTPTKMMIRAADLLAEARRIPGVAGRADVTPDWAPVARRIAEEATHHWHDDDTVQALQGSGVTIVRGTGRLVGTRRVEVSGRTFRARRGVVLATGTEPGVPPIAGLAETPYWTNRDIVKVADLPTSLIVVGGGPIGAELSQVFARFGAEVTLLEVAERILATDEPEVSVLMDEVLTGEGIRVLASAEISKVEHADGQFSVRVGAETVRAERLLVAAGRDPCLADLGLEAVGLDPEAEALDTDGHMVAAEGVWAIGDITGRGAFTHVAVYQATLVTRAILEGDEAPTADYRAVPRVTFTDPECASVGMTEEQAREDGISVRVGSADLADSSRGWLHHRGNRGLVKVVEDASAGVLVGATVAGPCGGELLAHLTLAIHARVPTSTVASMIYAFPTFHQAIKSALDDLG